MTELISHLILREITVYVHRDFKIFLLLRFYVKSTRKSSKTAVLVILGALNIVDLVNISIQKVQKFIKIKIQSL